MAPVYADHPFALIPTPLSKVPKGEKADYFDLAASDMALAHSLFLRGLNAVYLQAPHITPADERSFVQYVRYWHLQIEIHHHGEETLFFPAVEAMAGEKGIMEVNIAQHGLFHDGLAALGAYADSCAAGKEKFDGKRVTELIDNFGPVMRQHLADEIDTLVGLRKYGEEKMKGLPKAMQEHAEHSMKNLGLFTGLPAGVFNIDVNYEDGLWKNWPPAPPGLFWVVRWITSWWHNDWYKFSPVDRYGQMRPLYASKES